MPARQVASGHDCRWFSIVILYYDMRENAIKPIIITTVEVTAQPYPVPYVFHRPGGPSAADFLPGEPVYPAKAF